MNYLINFPLTVLLLLGSCKDNKIQPHTENPPAGKIVYTISSGSSRVAFDSTGKDQYGVIIYNGDSSTAYERNNPLEINIIPVNGTPEWIDSSYQRITPTEDGVLCSGQVVTPNGSIFRFTDLYKPYNDEGLFEIDRVVVVDHASAKDKGFASRLAFHRDVKSAMSDYEFFVPSVWYKHNAYVPSNALASDPSDQNYWFREDRLPLPLFMIRETNNGNTFSIYHKDADGSTFVGEDGLSRIIDGRIKFASMGMENKDGPLVGILFPGSEGERTGVFGFQKAWAYRDNPVSAGYTQTYNVVVSLSETKDFLSAMKDTWHQYFTIADPAIYDCDLNQVYQSQIDVLDKYWKDINRAPGFPFAIQLNGVVQKKSDYSYNMGFVGMEIPNAALLIREGIKSHNSELLDKGEQIAAWWSENMFYPPNGSIRTWYNPFPKTWRTNYPTYMRVVGDGLKGLLWAWSLEKKRGVDKPSWLAACEKGAAWLISHQASDGSFPRSIHYLTNTIEDHEKTNTSHVIPFLAELYMVTKKDLYKEAALQAGNYIYDNSYEKFRYVGGTPDNPNVPDKEAASMALRAYLALYDLDGKTMWLNAAEQAAYYYQTWIYCWDVPIPLNDPKRIYPKGRSVTGISVIATANNASDTYAAIDAFNFYRLYLYTGDKQLLSTSKLMLKNTKQALNWNPADPIPGYGPGMANEAMTIMIPRGHGLGFYLPWQCYNFLEPMVLLQDVFGYFDIAKIEKTESVSEKKSKNDSYSSTRGLFILR